MTQKISYSLLPGQKKFVLSRKKQVFYSGGFGSGKSQALCYAMLRQITVPNNQVLLIRKTLTSLKKSTLVNLIGANNPVLPQGSYVYNKGEGTIQVNNGALIYTCGLEDPMRIRSMNLGAIYVDELTEFTEEEFKELTYRLRLDLGSRQIFAVGNPAGQNHWAYKHFFLEDDNDREVIIASSLENSYLPADYLKELSKMDGPRYKRYVEGLWVALDDVIFDSFDRDIHVQKFNVRGAFDEYFFGIDYGYANETGIVVVGKNGDRLHVIEEVYQKKMLMRHIVEKVQLLMERYPEPTILYDPSAAGLGAELENRGISANRANNDVAAGIDRIRNKLLVRNDMPDLIISDKCINLIKEIENYQYVAGTEKPKKEHDHLIDPLRYVCNYVDDNRAESTAPGFYAGTEDYGGDEDDIGF